MSIHGLPALQELRESLHADGIGWISLEEFYASPVESPVIAVWDFGSVARLPSRLADASQGRITAWSLESPLVAHRGYHRLRAIAQQAAHVVGYPGVSSLLNGGTATFHAVGWPNRIEQVNADPPWEQRDLLVMINSNKRLHQWREGFSLHKPKASARLLASSLLARSYSLRRQWSTPDLYNERLRAIAELGHHSGFSLFGVGWSSRLPGWSDSVWESVQACYQGEVSEKQEALRRFRFALCIENTVFPGYVSEKIFDAFFAGTIPIYLGAPDIERYVPEGTFIDLRRFRSYEALVRHIDSLEPSAADGYLAEAERFLTSPAAKLFTNSHFVNEMRRTIEPQAG